MKRISKKKIELLLPHSGKQMIIVATIEKFKEKLVSHNSYGGKHVASKVVLKDVYVDIEGNRNLIVGKYELDIKEFSGFKAGTPVEFIAKIGVYENSNDFYIVNSKQVISQKGAVMI